MLCRDRFGGFVEDWASFDAACFGISPSEAVLMDPQQRVMLQVTITSSHHGLSAFILAWSRLKSHCDHPLSMRPPQQPHSWYEKPDQWKLSI